ncbi:hypothetical protein Taro_041573 [Colocasia esculenta]|uniref:Uncharacterized protein n=1 Tax=Colocasia esculenta TaxID=4460 RepID=A0A843WQA1_COLES|nr:hypothetical protein [Colocasia esculenta]
MSTRHVQNATVLLVATPSEVAVDQAVTTLEGFPSPEKGFCPFSSLKQCLSQLLYGLLYVTELSTLRCHC